MPFNIVYEDKDLLVVNKPAGVVVHPDESHKSGTIIQTLAKKYPEIEKVHRLDKDTSGLLVFAKNQKSLQYLKKLFEEKAIQKSYLVLVVGKIKNDRGVIDLPIGRSRKDMRRISGKGIRGKEREAVTEYEVIKRFDGYALVEARPLTGRTHQIRSHFSAIGHPVACDKLYSGKRYVCPAGLDRQFLHAWKLEFISPSGTKLLLEADLPEDLERVLGELR